MLILRRIDNYQKINIPHKKGKYRQCNTIAKKGFKSTNKIGGNAKGKYEEYKVFQKVEMNYMKEDTINREIIVQLAYNSGHIANPFFSSFIPVVRNNTLLSSNVSKELITKGFWIHCASLAVTKGPDFLIINFCSYSGEVILLLLVYRTQGVLI